MPIETINPATGETLATFDEADAKAIDATLTSVHDAFLRWRSTSMAERAALLERVAARLDAGGPELALLATIEMGKTIGEARAEVKKCAVSCRHYAAEGARYLAPIPVESGASESYVEFAPLGPVLAIMPWNFPFWQLVRAAAPVLMAGNALLLKHASNVPQCALAIERVFVEAGAPAGLVRTLLVSGARAEGLIDDPRIAAVTLTGSEAVGARVAARAGRALKKQVLELGGSDAFIVLADADLEAAARVAVRARFQNCGQSCIAAKRFIVERAVHEAFVERFAALASALRVGDPQSDDTEMGPMARADLREDLASQVRRSVEQGARVVIGGAAMTGPGAYFAATILDRVTEAMPAFVEETFGPVAAVIAADDAEHAIALANRSAYGLGSALWTRDLDRARRIAPRIEAGSVFVNGMVASDPRLPFGGVKKSGYGRELAEWGIREFTNVQTVWIGPARDAAAGMPKSE